MDDTQLLHSYLAEGSEAAFSELVGRYINLVHSAALRQVGGDFHRAKDVTQMVFVLLARKASKLTGHTALAGWLYASTHFSAATLMRQERRRQTREEKGHAMNSLSANPEAAIDWDRLWPVLDGAMLELNERDREAVLWRFFDRQPLAAIGQKLGVSENAAGLRVGRALEKMRRALIRRGVDSTTAALALMLANHAVVAAPAGLAESATIAALASATTKLALGASGLFWIAGMLVIPAIGVAGYELWAVRHAEASLAIESDGYSRQQQHWRALNRAARAGDQNVGRLATALDKLGPKAAPPGASHRDPKADSRKFLAAYPQVRPMVIGHLKSLAAQLYGSFFRSAGLTPFQIEQFENALAESWIANMTFSPRETRMGDLSMPSEDRMKAILGDEAYGQYRAYSRIAYAHYEARTVAGEAAEEPLSPDQIDQLAQIVANHSTMPRMDYPTLDSINALARTAIDWDAVLPQAKALLSAGQWKAAEPTLLKLQAAGAFAKARQSSQ